jgi:uncharacterized protein YraI
MGALLAAAAGLPGAAYAQTLTAFTTVDLNLRAGPGPEFPVLLAMPSNTAIEVFGCLDDRLWCEVTWNGNRGWAYSTYLTIQTAGQVVVLQQAPTPPPMVMFPGEQYWVQHYPTQPFFVERQRWFGPGAGAIGGATIGAILGGPIGAAIGAGVGAAAGAAAAVAVDPPQEVRAYVMQQQPTPVFLQGEVVIGAQLPEPVMLQPIPNYTYAYAYINSQWVLVDPTTRAIVHVFL